MARLRARLPAQPAAIVLMLAGVLVSASALLATLPTLGGKIDIYDGGILLTHTELVANGEAPHEDFYTSYPPGIYWLIRAAWDVLGVSIGTTRLLGFALHLALAALVGRLAGRIAGESFSWLAAGLTLLYWSLIGVEPLAWLAALCAALLAVELVLVAWKREQARWWLAPGLALGLVGGFRHDLLVYLALTLAVCLAAYYLAVRRSLPARSEWVVGLFVAGGALVPLLLVYAPTLAQAGWDRVADDLFFDQVEYAGPARDLPLPPLLALRSESGLPVSLPAFLARPGEGAMLLTLIAPVIATLAAFVAYRKGRFPALLPLALIGALAVAVLPQLLGRSDAFHAYYTLAPGLILVAGLAERLARSRAPIAVVGALLAAVLLAYPARDAFRGPSALSDTSLPGTGDRLDGPPSRDIEARRRLLDFIHARTPPGAPIFVGSTDHRFTYSNDVSLYYVAQRPGPTRYLQFDAGIETRAEVQHEIAGDLERRGVKVVVLLDEVRYRPDKSARGGASILDDYLRSRYHLEHQFDVNGQRYSALVRNP